jgi:hypothetical protein
MSLDTRLFVCRFDDTAPPLRRREMMDAIIGRLPEAEWRQRIGEHGALRVAIGEIAWLLNENGTQHRLDPPVHACPVAVRRIGDAPVFLTPLDLLSTAQERRSARTAAV